MCLPRDRKLRPFATRSDLGAAAIPSMWPVTCRGCVHSSEDRWVFGAYSED